MLAVIMLVTAFPFVTSALTHAEYDYVFSPYATLGFEYSHTEKMGVETLYNGAYPYFHLSAAAGDYNNSDLIFSFKPLNTKLGDKPYIKICYRTNSPAARLDVSMISPTGEKWMNTHPAINNDENFNTLIFNYNDITGSNDPFPNKTESNITIRLKPFGAQQYTLENDFYFDINYIALFASKAEAEAFSYNEVDGIASGYKHNILSPDALYTYYGGSSATESVTYNILTSESSFVRYLAAPGTYGNNDLIVSFSHDAFSLLEYPYVNVCYKTDSPASKLDVSMTSESGENWLSGGMPSLTNNGKVSNIIFSINDMTGSSAPAPNPGSMNITVRLKPWGAGDKTLTRQSYFDLMYVGFFKTRDEAENFVYPGNSKYRYNFKLNDSVPPYYFASKATVRKYIDEADAREYEIAHTNNTVPYVNHLTFAGMNGSYAGNSDSSNFKITANSGSYAADKGVITFTEKDFSMESLPYVKISYKSDSAYGLKTYAVNSSGRETELTAKNGIYNLSGTSASSLKLMPFGTGSRTLAQNSNFAIDYIGFFKTEAEANSFKYTGENGANMTSTHVIYTANLLDPANTATGTVHYVSSSTGSDSNDGLTPETAWKTIDKLNSAKPRGTVFFKRGDTFRYTGSFNTQDNTVYTSYGYGDKPKFVASIDGADSSLWSRTENENIWVFKNAIANDTQQGDVGHIRINGGKLWGIKVVKRNDSDMRCNNGNVFNGRTHIGPLADKPVNGGLGLYNDLEFFHDYESGKLYLYCADGNPGKVFDSIEIADKGNAITFHLSNSTLDNLYVTGTGSHGMGYGNVKNAAVTNCYLEWIGGSIQTLNFTAGATTPTRFGNAVESYGSAVNFTIANCFASQIYDCCWTVQNQGAVTFKDVFMYDNVAEYANSGLEIWQSGGVTDNLYLHDNYTMYGGYGWSHQRPNKDGNFFYGGTGINATTYKNCSIENNINVLASSRAVLASAIGSSRYNFNHNIYIMAEGKTYTVAPRDTEHGKSASGGIPYDYTNIQRTYALGTDKGSTFYYVPKNLFNIGDDPYKVFSSCDKPIYDIYTENEFLIMRSGDTYQIEATVAPSNTDDDVYYSSTNPNVATCTQNGKITASYPGTATIVISAVNSEVQETIDVQVISNLETTSIWTKDDDDGYNTDILFIGDNLFCGENTIADAIEENYYVTSQTYAVMNKTLSELDVDNIPDYPISPEILMLSAGYNDYKASVPLSEFKDELKRFVLDLHREYPVANIIMIMPPLVTDKANSAGLTLKNYIDAAISISDDLYFGYANLYTMSDNQYVLRDKNGNIGQPIYSYIDNDMVPSAKGTSLLANDIMSILSELGFIVIEGEYSYRFRYSANDLATNVTASSGLKYAGRIRDDAGIFLRFAPDGSQTSAIDPTGFDISFSDADLKLKEYPILKVYYRSNIADSAARIDLNAGALKNGVTKRMWGGGRISYVKNGTLSSFTFDMSAFNGGEGINGFADADANSPVKYLRFKPYDFMRPINANDYFDIESVAFYKTIEEAARDGKPEEEKPPVYNKGDVNTDGKTDIIDLLVLSRHHADWLGYKNEIDFICSDVNADGYVDLLDCTILARHLALWSEHKILG